jgi:hypothetical protein
MTILVNGVTMFAFYQAYECLYGCCAYLGIMAVMVTNVTIDFLVTVITMVTRFTLFCCYRSYCLP